jgi:adenylate cyclase
VRRSVWLALVVLPVAGLVLLLGKPSLDVRWEHHPAHFWLVVLAGVLTFALGFLLGEAASRRADARVLLVSLAFLAAAGFLALHALATPGVLLAGSNAGFQLASPVGLLLAGAFAGASALDLEPGRSAALVRRRRRFHLGLLALMGAWAGVSLASVPPLDDPIPAEETRGPLLALAVAGGLLYGFASLRYARLYARRRTSLLLAIVTAFILLAEAMVAVALGRNWHATWWEWHLLMLVAFAVVAASAQRHWREEGAIAELFSALYEDATWGREEEMTILFADLQGFTSFAEHRPEGEVREMLDEYFRAGVPALRREARTVTTIGDAVMASFSGGGHAGRGAAASLTFMADVMDVASRHPDWPRFRAGVNSGRVRVGLVAATKEETVIGDAVNIAARLEGQARVGEVVVGEATRAGLGAAASVEDLGEVPVRGRKRPVRAYVLRRLASDGHERDERLQEEEDEAAR